MHTATMNALPITASMALVVDDDAFSRDLFCEMLRALGVTDIRTADNGRTALRTLKALPEPPNVVICDIFMPDMDGFEFLPELAKTGYSGGVILVSGVDITMMAIAQEVAIGEGLNVLGAYTKPVPQALLKQALLLLAVDR
jgi:CheY-like chemotaxis protein